MEPVGDEVTLDLPRNGRITLETDSQVVIGVTGDRFHKPGFLSFPTACKTAFREPIEEVFVTDAVARGYLPCEKPDCYG